MRLPAFFINTIPRQVYGSHYRASMKKRCDTFSNISRTKALIGSRGVGYGPSSPPIDLERQHLPVKYQHRLYGDITHTVRCQYPTENWDQAYALTLGRECTNPQPYYYSRIFREDMPFTDGFLSYSDGVHDDVNKVSLEPVGHEPGTIAQRHYDRILPVFLRC